jgi:hypothetical protein
MTLSTHQELDVAQVSAMIDHPDRDQPLVLVTGSDRPDRLNPDITQITEAIGDAGIVVHLPDHATQIKFSDLRGDDDRTFSGAVRIYFPRTTRSYLCGPARTDFQASQVIKKLREVVHGNYQRSPGAIVYTTETAAAAPSEETEDITAQDFAAMAEELAVLRRRLAVAEDQARAARATARDAARAARATSIADQPPVFSDPERQFRHDVWLHWLASVPEPERDQWPLRKYVLGPEWLDSYFATPVGLRPKVLGVAVEVITRRATEITARDVRPHHSGSGGSGAENMSRPVDNARAWRCSVQIKTPQARRMMWWEIPGGTLELGRVALHDDDYLP